MSKVTVVKKISYGVFGAITDFLLWQFFLFGASFGKPGSRGVFQASREADEMLQKINHKTIVSIFYQMRKKGLLTYDRRKNISDPKITDLGRKRLKQIVPAYLAKRPWDQKVYLITYDIPEKARSKRNRFRSFLQTLGCRLFQESIWITPYNPRQLIREFIDKYNIPGTIIVSDIGRGSGIGEGTIQNLIVRLYSLQELNDRYEKFMQNAKQKKQPVKYLLLEYLSILKDDPQLPFPLLSKNWLGDKACRIYQNLQRNL